MIDNNVPHSVTLFLRDKGHDAVEVRDVLTHDAPDDAVVAYAASQHLILVTHDPGCARKATRQGVQHLRLRTSETQDRDRLRDAYAEVLGAIRFGATRVSLFKASVRAD